MTRIQPGTLDSRLRGNDGAGSAILQYTSRAQEYPIQGTRLFADSCVVKTRRSRQCLMRLRAYQDYGARVSRDCLTRIFTAKPRGGNHQLRLSIPQNIQFFEHR